MKIKILNLQPFEYQTFPFTEDMINISDDEERLLLSGRPVKYENGKIAIDEELEIASNYEALKEQLRERRELECFPYVNRSNIWFLRLSREQRIELTDWYDKWLQVTETLVAPDKPEWLK